MLDHDIHHDENIFRNHGAGNVISASVMICLGY